MAKLVCPTLFQITRGNPEKSNSSTSRHLFQISWKDLRFLVCLRITIQSSFLKLNICSHELDKLLPDASSGLVFLRSPSSLAKRSQGSFHLPLWIETIVPSVFKTTLAHSPFRVTDMLQPETTEL